MRAIAVLCMVEVHTAAILPPKGITVGHPAAFVAAAFGGMAAPMFVTISGWGMYRGARRRFEDGFSAIDWLNWILPRFAILFLCQLLVNLLLNVERGGRFEFQTPGVLTLLAFATVISPLLARLSTNYRLFVLVILGISPIFLGSLASPEIGWFQRVNSNGLYEWLERLLWNGTYPLFPWLFFVFLGTIVHDLRDKPRIREMAIFFGIIFSIITILFSFYKKTAWALTSGEAILTFFPASVPFLLVSGSMVVLVMRILEGGESRGRGPSFGSRLSFLEPAGRLSLTIYVTHFAVLGVAAYAMEGERLDVIPALLVTMIHTLLWIPLAHVHERRMPNISFEGILRKLS